MQLGENFGQKLSHGDFQFDEYMVLNSKYSIIFGVLISSIVLSCGTPAYYKQITDQFYLFAPDVMSQLAVIYQTDANSNPGIVPQTVCEIAHNEDYIIVKQCLEESTQSVAYYIIDVKAIKKDRQKFVPSIDTTRSRMVLKDKQGNDSLGAEEIYVTKRVFRPSTPQKLTYQEFLKQKQTLNIPDSLVLKPIL